MATAADVFGYLILAVVLPFDCYMIFWQIGPELVQDVRDWAMGHKFEYRGDMDLGSTKCRCGAIRTREFPHRFWRKRWLYYEYESAAPAWARCGTASVLNQLVKAGRDG